MGDPQQHPHFEGSGLTYQEGAEENERHKVEIGKITATFLFGEAREGVTGSVAQAGQHDLVPGFPRGAPATPEQRLSLSTPAHDSHPAIILHPINQINELEGRVQEQRLHLYWELEQLMKKKGERTFPSVTGG